MLDPMPAVTTPQLVADLPRWRMPSGVTVTPSGRIFLCFPRWFEFIPFTVAELVGGDLVPFPTPYGNGIRWSDPVHQLFSVQSVVASDDATLWVLDTGRPYFLPSINGAAKLLSIDLATGALKRIYTLPAAVTNLGSYVNDVRFAPSIGSEGTAFITDSATLTSSALIVIDLATGRKLRRLENHPSVRIDPTVTVTIGGEALRLRPGLGISFPYGDGADGIALSPDETTLSYCPLTSRRLYAIDAHALADPAIPEEALATLVRDCGPKPVSDGLECDAHGTLYATDIENNRIVYGTGHGPWQTLVSSPAMLWTDTMSVAADGYLYFTCNQIHLAPPFHDFVDHRKWPYKLFRTPLPAAPPGPLPTPSRGGP